MPDAPHIAFSGSPPALSQRITAGARTGAAALSGEGRDLRLVVDGRPRLLSYRSAHQQSDGVFEAVAEDESVHVETRIAPGPGFLSVVSRLTALRPIRLSAFEHAYLAHDLRGRDAPDDLWLPLLPGKPGRALALAALPTPCIALQSGARVAALLGDLDALEARREHAGLVPVVDFERPAILRAGLAAGRPARAGLLERRPAEGVLLPDHDVATLSFLIVLSGDAQPHAGIGEALRAIWARFGARRLDDLALQRLPFDDYARYAYDAAFDRYALRRDVFLEEGTGGAFAAATPRRDRRQGAAAPAAPRPWRIRARAALSRHVPWRERLSVLRATGDRASDYLHFGAGANALRTAYGMAHFARRWSDERLLGAAQETVRLALAAPEVKGLFPAVYVGTPDRPAWARGTRGALLDDRYVLADLCESGLWMLRLAGDLGLGDGLVERARRLGDTLIGAQDPGGALPACLTVSALGGVHRAGSRRLSAVTAIGGAFLAHLGTATGDQRFLEAAGRAAAHLVDRVWPAHAWRGADIHPSAGGRPRRRDDRTGLAPQDTLPMAWAVDLLLALWESQEAGWLDHALAMLDALLLHQQIWKAQPVECDLRGGFGATNHDARRSDARTALLAPLLLRAYRATGTAEYGLRGAAALRAGFTLMLLPENTGLAPANTAGITEADYGLAPPWLIRTDDGSPDPAPLCFDWGAGSACAAAAWTQRHFGDLFVHFGGKGAIGLNGCRVIETAVMQDRVDLGLERLAARHPQHRHPLDRHHAGMLEVRAEGLPPPRVRISIDGGAVIEAERKALLDGFAIPLPPP